MSASLCVHLLPTSLVAEELPGSTAVVIDVLRATTCMVQATGNGVRAIHPCQTVEAARRKSSELGPGTLLAGERGGLAIDGFHLGNSPSQFTAAAVAGRDLVMTTTNGTRALLQCHLASRVLIAAFTNLSAIVTTLKSSDRVEIVCAGTGGAESMEDILLAGAIVAGLEQSGRAYDPGSDAGQAAAAWRSADKPLDLANSLGGRNLLAIGRRDDVAFAAQIDLWNHVPEWRGAVIR